VVVVNYIRDRYQIKGVRDAIANSRRVRARDRNRRKIYKTYKETTRILKEKGRGRMVSETVREYEKEVSEALPVDPAGLGAVTEVFEEARYSDHRMEPRAVKRARKGLKKVSRSLEDLEEKKA
jgi:hypothetical protein